MAYSQELRDRVLGASDRGMQTKQIADTLGVCRAWVRRVKQRRRETGETTARPMGGARVIKIDVVRLAELVAEQPDATIPELRDRLGVECSECRSAKDRTFSFPSDLSFIIPCSTLDIHALTSNGNARSPLPLQGERASASSVQA